MLYYLSDVLSKYRHGIICHNQLCVFPLDKASTRLIVLYDLPVVIKYIIKIFFLQSINV